MGTIELGTTTSRVVLVIIVDWLPLVNRDRKKKKKKTQNLGEQLKKKFLTKINKKCAVYIPKSSLGASSKVWQANRATTFN
jgi:hypothetical protein